MKFKYSLFALIFPVLMFTFKNTDSGRVYSERAVEINSDKTFLIGEEFRYIVSYAFIDLGEVKIKVTGKNVKNGKNYYNAIAYIDSYSGLPFVDLHQIYETIMTDDCYSDFFRGIVQHEEYKTFTEYDFRYENKSVHVLKGKVKPREVWTDSTGTVDKKYQDGLSILYYARMNSGRNKTVNLPCLVNEEKVYTKINFYSKPEPVEIDAVDYEINTVRLDGHTDFVSVFGLTGNFEGWFTNDEVSVPVLAKMKVIIGNVTLELVEWKREGWSPPRFN